MTSATQGPAVLGRYRLLRHIGEGGMGVVHLASGPDGYRVALKVLRPHVVGDREGRDRLAREIASLQRVRSRRVAEFLDADPWGPTPFVVTRFVPGLSLSDYVDEYGPLHGQQLVRLAGGLAEALAAVHAVGVVHRDVKPSNVLLEGQDPVLIDFGLARAAEDAAVTMTGQMLGTPAYLSPEIALGHEPGAGTDVHSWASTVAFACRGSSPFGRGPQTVLLDRVRRNAYDLDGVPDDLRDMLMRCLDADPLARPPATVLAGWLAGAPGGAAATVHIPAAPAPPLVAPTTVAPSGSPTRPPTTVLAESGALSRPLWQAPAAAPYPEQPPPDSPAHPSTPAQLPGQLLGPPTPEPRPRPWPERVAAAVLGSLLSVWLVAFFAAAPYVTAAAAWTTVTVLVTWDRGVDARRQRRSRRGVRRGDGVVAALLAPWHALVGIAQATVLVAAALLAAALVDGMLHLGSVRTSELVWAGALAFALVLWRGPGGRVLHRPAHRAVDRGSTAGVWAVVLIWLLAALVAGTIGVVQGVGTAWFPAAGPPL